LPERRHENHDGEKNLRDGSPCKKCGEVLERMEKDDQLRRMDEILVADERDPGSDGMLLAAELGVERAPFFVVTRDDGSRQVYTVYLQFVKKCCLSRWKKKMSSRKSCRTIRIWIFCNSSLPLYMKKPSA
jgi:hypothetical protein